MTACGKGCWECKKGEPKELELSKPAFEFFCTKVAILSISGTRRQRASSRPILVTKLINFLYQTSQPTDIMVLFFNL